jgi:proteasome alpha subunit
MQPLQNAGYDRAITVFSPDGRLFQVEYAREAVKRGTTSIGVKSSEGIVLAVDKRTTSKLVEASSIEKIFKIDEHIGAATSGLVADARALVERARVEAQINKITYSEPIRVTSLSKKLCDMLQLYTQNGGVRPFGSALIIGGIYNGKCKLFETDPSGALIEYKATAIGSGRNAAMDIFEEKYEDSLTLEGAIELALAAINEATDHETTSNNVEIAVIKIDDEKYVKLSQDEVQKYIDEVLPKEEEEDENEEYEEDSSDDGFDEDGNVKNLDTLLWIFDRDYMEPEEFLNTPIWEFFEISKKQFDLIDWKGMMSEQFYDFYSSFLELPKSIPIEKRIKYAKVNSFSYFYNMDLPEGFSVAEYKQYAYRLVDTHSFEESIHIFPLLRDYYRFYADALEMNRRREAEGSKGAPVLREVPADPGP